MKKFLFTLAALLMVGSAFAQDAENYFTVDDFEVAQDQLGTNNVRVNVKAHFANYVSAWQVNFTYPEGITCRGFVKGSDLTLTYFDELGDEQSLVPALNKNADNTRCIVASTEAAYDADGNYMGAAQWGPGEYAQMWQLVLVVAEDFAGGEMMIHSEPASSGWGDHSNDCPKNTYRDTFTQITVEGGEIPTPDLTGTITFGEITEDGLLPISYNGDEDVTITVTVNGQDAALVDGNVQLAEGENEVVVTATCQGYNDLVVTQVFTYTAPVIEVTATPTIQVTEGDEAYIFTVVGDGELHLYANNVEVENPFTVARGETDVTYYFTATAQEEGKEISVPAELTIVVPALEVTPQPEVTATPTIQVTEGDEAYIFTVVGDGELHLYANNVEVENPFTVARGETDVTYYFTATAQEEGKEISVPAELTIVVPALQGGETPDPHAEGVWMVVYTQDGQEVWNEMMYSNGQYTIILPLEYDIYGTFDYNNGAVRPDVAYYIYINGVRYGAQEGEMTETYLGNALMNPLAQNDNCYYLANGLGYIYNMGVFYDHENDIYDVYAAIAGTVGVDELVNGKQIAGVRYFNMAGQEMQEANGMTIVVTTYTDGTTSAVKVMK